MKTIIKLTLLAIFFLPFVSVASGQKTALLGIDIDNTTSHPLFIYYDRYELDARDPLQSEFPKKSRVLIKNVIIGQPGIFWVHVSSMEGDPTFYCYIKITVTEDMHTQAEQLIDKESYPARCQFSGDFNSGTAMLRII